MNRNFVISGLALVAIVIAGILIAQALKNKPLSTGKIVQETPVAGQSGQLMETLKTKPQVQIATNKGDFVIELRPDVAPKTVTNFLAKFSTGYCNNLSWHRVED